MGTNPIPSTSEHGGGGRSGAEGAQEAGTGPARTPESWGGDPAGRLPGVQPPRSPRDVGEPAGPHSPPACRRAKG